MVAEFNQWITNNAYGSVTYSSDQKAITWSPVPIAAPSLRGVESLDGDFLLASLAKETPPGGGPQLQEMAARVTSITNLCYFDREKTGERLHQWLFMSQLARITCRRAQIPTNAVTLGFLSAVTPKLASSATEVAQTGPGTLSFARKSQLGFTGFELNLLADWLESPEFPRGLHTLLAPRPAMSLGRPRPSAAPPAHP